MTTSSTKTRALCVATRCTSVEQFVATFHRFCGDDQTFFVATMTSRPIGLETPFSIQLADKQPVLRGMCIVLDAWETPENRYRRPGIRLGIKRLTADSQVVFDRLQAAASRAPASVEATPPPGPAPLPSIASGSRPSIGRRAGAAPPPLPPLLAPRIAPSVPLPPPVPPLADARRPLPSVPPAGIAKPALAVVTVPPLPADAKPALAVVTVPPLPADAKRVTPPAIDAPRAAPAASEAPRVTPPAIEAQPPTRPTPPAIEAQPPTRPTPPAPIAVTRFQVALHVDTIPPPLGDVEFKPQELIPRKRAEPKIVSDAAPDEAPVDEAQPALIVDRRGAPVDLAASTPAPVPDPPIVPPDAAAQPIARPREPEFAEPRDTLPMLAAPDVLGRSELRTPGSALVLPANPLQDLSDESIEGFIDCTLYEETENIFHPAVDGPEWEDPTTESSLAPPDPSASVPAMPFDAAPDLTVQASGDNESLTVADDPALSRTASGELAGGGMVAEPVDDDAPSQPTADVASERPSVEITDDALAQSRTMSGELWSETVRRRTPATGTPRLQPRPDTPLPRPATNVPLDLGEAPDPASWFDSVSLPYGAGGAPAPQAPAVIEYLGPRPETPPGAYGIPPSGPLEPAEPYPMPPSSVEPAVLHQAPPPGSYVTPPGIPLDPSQLSAYPIAPPQPHYHPADLVMLPPPGIRPAPPWQRWLLIGGSAFIAIMIAFGIARMVRGSSRMPAISPLATAGAPSHAAPAVATPPPPAPAKSAPAPVATPAAAPAARTIEPADSADTGAADPVAEDDGEKAAGGAPVVGSGPCRFTVATTPAGSIIRLDDQAMGPSPITIEGSCDKHKIDISHARYQSVTRWLTLAADQPQSLDISLPRPIHAVTVTSFPLGAELSIDGHRAGTTPTVVQMTGFATVNLTFTKPGFQTVTKKIYSKVAQDRVFVKLMK